MHTFHNILNTEIRCHAVRILVGFLRFSGKLVASSSTIHRVITDQFGTTFDRLFDIRASLSAHFCAFDPDVIGSGWWTFLWFSTLVSTLVACVIAE